ncbi:MAG: hypothetical protein RIS92_740 [Verrucomicrobiota bacterium]
MAVVSDRRFRVGGIHCAGCVSRIRGALERLSGVDAVVLGVEGDLVVRGSVEVRGVEEAIVALGFSCSEFVAAAERAGKEAFGDDGRREVLELVLACVLFLPLMAGTMLSHLGGLHGWAWGEGWIGALLSGGILFGCAGRRWVSVVRTLAARSLSMDVTVMAGGLIAWGVSLVGVLRGGAVYFEAAAGIVVVQMFGRWMESRLRRRAGAVVEELGRLQPALVSVLSAEGLSWMAVDAVAVGERFVVKAGERVPLDGVVELGEASVDVGWLTGESEPRRLMASVEVIAGAMVLEGEVTVRSTETVRSGTLERMRGLMRMAEADDGRGHGWVERWVAGFSAGLLAVAGATGLGWCLMGGQPWDVALMRAATVLVAGCPCALGLAVPMVYRVATGAGVRRGLLIGDAGRLARFGRVTEVIFDKTGTLTEPLETVPEMELAEGWTEREFWVHAVGLEAISRHPFAAAVRRVAAGMGLSPVTFSRAREVPGEGVEGEREGKQWRLIRDVGGWSRMEVSGVFVGRARFSERMRLGVREVVRQLVSEGVGVHLASGDVEERVLAVGEGLGLAAERCHAGMRPEDKLALCRRFRDCGGVVAMVGDGVNDAAILRGADVGIAVGGASGVARVSAHVELLRPGLGGVLEARALGQMMERAVRQSLVFAVTYNLLTVPLAAGVFLGVTGWDFTPVQASLAMAASSVSVVANALWWGHRFESGRKE